MRYIFRGCVSEVAVPSYSVNCYIYIPEHGDFVSIIEVQSMVCANDLVHYSLKVVDIITKSGTLV